VAFLFLNDGVDAGAGGGAAFVGEFFEFGEGVIAQGVVERGRQGAEEG
jgi:hypothetical protein